MPRTIPLGSATLIGAAVLALSTAGHAWAESGDMLELTLALGVVDANFNTTNSSVYRLADDLGFYEKHGVHVTFVAMDGTPQAVAALNAGAVDLADISIDSAIRLRADNDVPIKGIVAVAKGSSFLIAARSDIQTVQDLAGRPFAIADFGSLDHSLTQAVLRSMGITETPDYVAIGAPDVRVQALAAGQVEATSVSFGTYSSIEGTPDVHVLVDPNDFAGRAPPLYKFVAALEPTIEQKGDAIERFTEALIDASRAMEADPQGWIEAAAAARPDLSRKSIEATSQLIANRWCINGCMAPADLEESVNFVYASPDFQDVKRIGVEEITDPSFTTRALEDLGTAGGTGLDARN